MAYSSRGMSLLRMVWALWGICWRGHFPWCHTVQRGQKLQDSANWCSSSRSWMQAKVALLSADGYQCLHHKHWWFIRTASCSWFAIVHYVNFCWFSNLHQQGCISSGRSCEQIRLWELLYNIQTLMSFTKVSINLDQMESGLMWDAWGSYFYLFIYSQNIEVHSSQLSSRHNKIVGKKSSCREKQRTLHCCRKKPKTLTPKRPKLSNKATIVYTMLWCHPWKKKKQDSQHQEHVSEKRTL